MVPTAAAAGPADPNGIPLFDLATIGGLAGVGRWVKLCEAHPRAVRPIVAPFRQGFPSAEVSILEVAAAIEYWVNVHSRRKWAERKRGAHAAALAAHVGTSFAEFVGNPQRWASEVQKANNKLKHDPKFLPDSVELVDLAVSARALLAAALLDRVAGNHEPSRALLRSHRFYPLRDRLRARFA